MNNIHINFRIMMMRLSRNYLKISILLVSSIIVSYQSIAMEQGSKSIEEKNIISLVAKDAIAWKRFEREVSKLQENKNLTIELGSADEKNRSFEMKISFFNNETEYELTCKTRDYPFGRPIVSLKDKNNVEDAIIIRNINNSLSEFMDTWSPAKLVNDIVNEAIATIKLYEEKKIASQKVVEGHKRTLDQLKAKYQPSISVLGGNYPAFQEKFKGLFIKERDDGYFVFQVDGNYINIAFEPKYIGAATKSYRGYYVASAHMKRNDDFHVSIIDVGLIDSFHITKYSDSISVTFELVGRDSNLGTIVSSGESIHLHIVDK